MPGSAFSATKAQEFQKPQHRLERKVAQHLNQIRNSKHRSMAQGLRDTCAWTHVHELCHAKHICTLVSRHACPV